MRTRIRRLLVTLTVDKATLVAAITMLFIVMGILAAGVTLQARRNEEIKRLFEQQLAQTRQVATKTRQLLADHTREQQEANAQLAAFVECLRSDQPGPCEGLRPTVPPTPAPTVRPATPSRVTPRPQSRARTTPRATTRPTTRPPRQPTSSPPRVTPTPCLTPSGVPCVGGV